MKVSPIAKADATSDAIMTLFSFLRRGRTQPHSGQLEAYLRNLCWQCAHSVVIVVIGRLAVCVRISHQRFRRWKV